MTSNFNGRVMPSYAFTAEDDPVFNFGGMYSTSMGMYNATGFTNFIGPAGIVPAVFGAKSIRKRRATKYAQDLDNSLRAQYPESDLLPVLQSSVDGLKTELEKQKSLRARAKSKGDKAKYDEGVQVVQDLLNFYQGRVAAVMASPEPKISVTPAPGTSLTGQPYAPPIVSQGDDVLGTATVRTSAPASVMTSVTPDGEPAAAVPAKRSMTPWLIAGGAALLLAGGYFIFRKK